MAWAEYCERHLAFVAKHARRFDSRYLRGLSEANFRADHMFESDDVNGALARFGWSVVSIEGSVPFAHYGAYLASRWFPMAESVRPIELIVHAPGPDRIHDLFGHFPFLFDGEYRTLLTKFAEASLDAEVSSADEALYDARAELAVLQTRGCPNAALLARAEAKVRKAAAVVERAPSEGALLERLFAWTVELGLVGTQHDYRLWGAVLLGSLEEAGRVVAGNVHVRPFSLREVMSHPVHPTGHPSVLYVVKDFAEVERAIDTLMALGKSNARCAG